MNNFPTMTAAQHAALIWRCEEVIRNCENAMYAEAMNEAEEMDLRITQIALAALTAEPVHQFIVNNPDNDGYVEWADCNTDYFSKEPRDMRSVLYTAPPAPVLRVPDGWIKCSERMPGDEYVLVADFDNRYPACLPCYQVGTYVDWFGDGEFSWDDGDGNDLHLKLVTHWMPLPQPPEASNEQ